ncbi:MAG: MOSC N-terminal beta barrel domain-containing protein [Alphaproteobacteria bacterium]
MAQQAKMGTVGGLFRYPVKSLRGEALTASEVLISGLKGDRHWAFRDMERNEITSAKRSPLLLQIAATLIEDGAVLGARISLPTGETFTAGAPDCSARVSAYVGRQLSIFDIRPASDTAHYARAKVAPEKLEATFREMLGLLPDEAMPDFSKMPPEALRNATLPGTYYDASTISIVLASELKQLRNSLPDAEVEAVRFRPNVVLDDLASPLSAESLVGVRMKIGTAEVMADSHAPRCSMTTHAQDRLPKAPQIMRTLVRDWKHNFGLYATVVRGGQIRMGDPVERL